ncbi:MULTISPECIES: RNA polymerase sigma factor [unclassified Lentimonas]|uniref:RNA polymerase sigma factor n=1 Tax=unclassified Lentimonas TaxID=2630993 RepID=UPI0013290200|nr:MULTISPECIES: sigma-70 family RNA polymerase sigma factor [unclassified Lentimonas]CAA6677650.1 RNA polymerase sigma factor RpoE [Lentimonas sp. CC4]CAA6684913.1 RNA polymerase sigma factor RpoE [Lentimonas sp. CC6]CAA6692473.1 RNA polymerase sigma factor RpoE [Lentimonas sp. CC19]CAA6693450.1 RNA polymerase sigma factor RpoE [Lentimonas sp. CC10]CAA7070779.1 RNA polymerase sigma factor RpoE [Lentimonas sp. CC11]
MEDTELLIQAKQGDLDAFTELVKRYQGNVRAALAVRLTNKHEAEDLAQEAFIIAFRKLNEFDVDKAFGPWIRSIAFNLLRNYWRKHKATLVGGAAELDILLNEQIGLEYSVENERDQLHVLKRCIAKLETPMRELLIQRYYQEMPIAEIKQSLKVNHSTVTMRLYRMRELLQQCMAKDPETA